MQLIINLVQGREIFTNVNLLLLQVLQHVPCKEHLVSSALSPSPPADEPVRVQNNY